MAAQAKIVARIEVQVERVIETDDGATKEYSYDFSFPDDDSGDMINNKLWERVPRGSFDLKDMAVRLPLEPRKKYHLDISEIEEQDLPF